MKLTIDTAVIAASVRNSVQTAKDSVAPAFMQRVEAAKDLVQTAMAKEPTYTISKTVYDNLPIKRRQAVDDLSIMAGEAPQQTIARLFIAYGDSWPDHVTTLAQAQREASFKARMATQGKASKFPM